MNIKPIEFEGENPLEDISMVSNVLDDTYQEDTELLADIQEPNLKRANSN